MFPFLNNHSPSSRACQETARRRTMKPFLAQRDQPMTTEQAYSELIQLVREASVLASCGSVLGWDESTYMPRNGSGYRGEQMALLARLGHEMITAPRMGELLAALEGAKLDEGQAANVREIRRGY